MAQEKNTACINGKKLADGGTVYDVSICDGNGNMVSLDCIDIRYAHVLVKHLERLTCYIRQID